MAMGEHAVHGKIGPELCAAPMGHSSAMKKSKRIVNHLRQYGGNPIYVSGTWSKGPSERRKKGSIDAVTKVLAGTLDRRDAQYDNWPVANQLPKDRKSVRPSYIQRKLGIGYNKAA